MLGRAGGGGCRGSDGRIQWCCHALQTVSGQSSSEMAVSIPEYTKTFNFLVAMMVTLCFGAEIVRLYAVKDWAEFADAARVTTHTFVVPSSSRMSKDTKAQAAAAQMMVDDEPDEWCAGMMSWVVVTQLADERTGTRESSAQAAQVRQMLRIVRTY